MNARYPYPVHLLIIPALRVLLGIRSSISHDARLLLTNVQPRPRILGAENIPADAPFILVVNHPDHADLGAWWGVSVIACAITDRRTSEPREMRFVMTKEWWYPSGWEKRIKQPLTHWFFGQMSKVYGMPLLPPVIEDYKGTGAVDVRKILALTRGSDPQLIGISPEGRTGVNMTLCQPPLGSGLFLEMLSNDKISFLPVGFFEDEENTMVANFGKTFKLDVPRKFPRHERDCMATRRLMVEIGKLLPEKMWGVYREEICAALNIR